MLIVCSCCCSAYQLLHLTFIELELENKKDGVVLNCAKIAMHKHICICVYVCVDIYMVKKVTSRFWWLSSLYFSSEMAKMRIETSSAHKL